MVVGANVFVHLRLIFQFIDRQHDKPLVAQFVIAGLHRRHLGRAGLAPGGPEIHQHDLPAVLAQALCLAVEIGQGEIGRRRTHHRHPLAHAPGHPIRNTRQEQCRPQSHHRHDRRFHGPLRPSSPGRRPLRPPPRQSNLTATPGTTWSARTRNWFPAPGYCWHPARPESANRNTAMSSGPTAP